MITVPAQWLVVAAPLAAAILIGILIAIPNGPLALLAIAAAIWLVLWSILWRAAFVGLFLFLPIAAVPGILLQQEGWPTLLKDGLFLFPGYVGLTLSLTRSRSFQWPLPAIFTMPLASLVAVVCLQALRLITSFPLVALIGLRSWLLYLPLVVTPMFIFRSIADVRRFIRLLVLVSLVPGLVGIVEFVLIVLGHSDLVYQLYGTLQSGVSQGFAQVSVSDQLLVHRVPSTFTFVTQFVGYCLITTPLALVVWMSDPDARWRRIGALASVAIVAAGFGSGSRTFYLWGPIEVGLMLLFMNRGRLQPATTIAITISIAVVTIGTQLAQVVTFISSLGWDYLVRTQSGEFPAVYNAVGLSGTGAGMGTSGSRYVLSSQTLPFATEGWYAVAFLELGLPGLVVILVIWSTLLGHAWRATRISRLTPMGPVAVATFVILTATVINLYKGMSLEYDPLNVYFWFIGGLALAIPRLGKLPASLAKSASHQFDERRP